MYFQCRNETCFVESGLVVAQDSLSLSLSADSAELFTGFDLGRASYI